MHRDEVALRTQNYLSDTPGWTKACDMVRGLSGEGSVSLWSAFTHCLYRSRSPACGKLLCSPLSWTGHSLASEGCGGEVCTMDR